MNQDRRYWLTIPEAAQVLGVKQEVAYWLTQNGYLPASEKLGRTNRSGTRVHRTDLDRFRKQHVFGSEIAELLGTSSRKVARLLAEHGIHPLRGHSNACRKIIYVRTGETMRFVAIMSGGHRTGYP